MGNKQEKQGKDQSAFSAKLERFKRRSKELLHIPNFHKSTKHQIPEPQQSSLQQKQQLSLQRQQIQKQSKQTFDDLQVTIISRILTFLDLQDILNLSLCCVRIYSQVNSSQSGIAQNFLSRNLNTNYSIFNPTIKSSLKRAINNICLVTSANWKRIYQNSLQAKNFTFYIGHYKQNKQNVEIPFFPATAFLQETLIECVESSFQQNSLRMALKYANGAIQQIENQQDIKLLSAPEYRKILFDMKVLSFESLEYNYTSLMNDNYCPCALKIMLQCYIEMIYQCRFFKQVLIDGLQDESLESFLNLYSLSWLNYSNYFIKRETHIEQALYLLNKVLSKNEKISNKLTLTDLLIQIWDVIVLDDDVQSFLITSFDSKLDQYRKEALLDHIDCGQQLKSVGNICTELLLKQVFQSLIDLSCSSQTISKIGNDQFKFHQIATDIIEIIIKQTNKLQKICRQKYPNNIQLAMELVQKDICTLKNICGRWCVQIYIETNQILFQKEYVKEILKTYSLENQNEPKEETELNSSIIIESNSSFNESQCQGSNQKSQDLIETLISEIVKEVQYEDVLPSTKRRESSTTDRTSSTQESSIFNSSVFSSFISECGEKDSSLEYAKDITSQITSYIKRNHKDIVDYANQIGNQETNLDLVQRDRNSQVITRSYYLPTSSSRNPIFSSFQQTRQGNNDFQNIQLQKNGSPKTMSQILMGQMNLKSQQ